MSQIVLTEEQKSQIVSAIRARYRPLRRIVIRVFDYEDGPSYTTYAPQDVELPVGTEWIGATVPVLSSGGVFYNVVLLRPLSVEIDNIMPVDEIVWELMSDPPRAAWRTRARVDLYGVPTVEVHGVHVPDLASFEAAIRPLWEEHRW